MNTFPITKSPKPPYDIAPEDNVIRSKSEDGATIARPRYTKIRNKYTLQWDCSNSEYTAVTTFYTNNCSIPFTLTFHTFSGNTEEDVGIEFSVTVTFSEPPKYKYVGIGAWEITCTFMEV